MVISLSIISLTVCNQHCLNPASSLDRNVVIHTFVAHRMTAAFVGVGSSLIPLLPMFVVTYWWFGQDENYYFYNSCFRTLSPGQMLFTNAYS